MLRVATILVLSVVWFALYESWWAFSADGTAGITLDVVLFTVFGVATSWISYRRDASFRSLIYSFLLVSAVVIVPMVIDLWNRPAEIIDILIPVSTVFVVVFNLAVILSAAAITRLLAWLLHKTQGAGRTST